MPIVTSATAPSAEEQELLELINRARLDPQGEFDFMIADADTQTGTSSGITSALRFFNVDVSAFFDQLQGLDPVAPVAWSPELGQASETYSNLMIAQDSQSHNLTDPAVVGRADLNGDGNVSLSERILDAGYSSQWSRLGENIFLNGRDNDYTHAAFYIDWGFDAEDFDNNTRLPNWQSLGDGIQDPPGHRNTILNGSFQEIGLGVVADSDPTTNAGPNVVTQHFGARRDYSYQLLGVVIDDGDGDAFYDVGEGLSSVDITAVRTDGLTVATTSWASGGYQMELAAGTYTVTFSGGGLTGSITETVVMGEANQKLDAFAADATEERDPNATYGDDENNTITGDETDDIIHGLGGNDNLAGEDGDDQLFGGPGDDVLEGGGDKDLIEGGIGADVLDGGTGDDTLRGQDGGDVISGRGGSDTIEGGDGDDVIDGGVGAEDVRGGAGKDSVFGGAGFDLIHGDAGNDTLRGNAGNDTIYGGADNDTILGGIGSDTLHGGDGNDTISGADGFDTINGDAGDDILDGNAGNDTVNGGAGNDAISGGIGADVLSGGADNDTILGSEGADTLSGDGGEDTLEGNAGNDTMSGGADNDDLSGGQGRDILNGDGGNDILRGQTGFDTLSGGQGDDELRGGEGGDRLDGGADDDLLVGGIGADVFVFNAGLDRIDDFSLIVDRIELDGAALGITGLDGTQVVDQFAQSSASSTTLVFDTNTQLELTGITNQSLLGDLIEVI